MQTSSGTCMQSACTICHCEEWSSSDFLPLGSRVSPGEEASVSNHFLVWQIVKTAAGRAWHG